MLHAILMSLIKIYIFLNNLLHGPDMFIFLTLFHMLCETSKDIFHYLVEWIALQISIRPYMGLFQGSFVGDRCDVLLVFIKWCCLLHNIIELDIMGP